MDLNQLSNIEIVGLTIYGEARGEPVEGQIAVGCVIRNRLHSVPGKTYHEIILAPKQFSCWNENDPNRVILLEWADKLFYGSPDIELRQALWIARGIIEWDVLDNTRSARHYMTSDLYRTKPPKWSKAMKVSKVIGAHTFLV